MIPGPVVVGGVGGSGTRVIAGVLRDAGYDLGPELNTALDNLWFTILFRRPAWRAAASAEDVARVLALFDDAMHGRLRRSPRTVATVWGAARAQQRQRPDHARLWRGRARRLLAGGHVPRPAGPWGWKEPNSHVYLPEMAEYFAGLRYIHVMRHGLDMAYSDNQNQVEFWADQFGVPSDGPPEVRSLRWWALANERAVAIGRERLDERFLLLNFDDLCTSPVDGVTGVLEFVGHDDPVPAATQFASGIRPPDSLGRHRQEDLSVFSPDDLDRVHALGFTIG